MPVDLSIVVPAYMEAEIIASSLNQLADWLDTHSYGQVEVIVVAADSTDGTADVAATLAHRFMRFQIVRPGARVGKGRDVRSGMLAATGRYRLFMDADLATPLHHLDDVKRVMDQNGQIGIAVRNLFKIHRGYLRKLMSKSANLAAQALAVPGIKDTQCGFKVFEASVAIAVFERMTMLKWSFDMEILAIARHLGYTISIFDVSDWHDPKEASEGLVGDSMASIVAKGFLDPFKIRLNIWRGRYNQSSHPNTV